jgi:long-chain fatty acid transport protein
LTFPDVYGLGAAFQPNAGALTIGFEWDQVGETVDPRPDGPVVSEGGSEFHIGAEYAVLRWKPVFAFRVGFWHEPDRDRHLTIEPNVSDTTTTDARTHFALGFGLAFKRFQIDAGADLSDGTAVGSFSIVYSF